MIEKSVFNKLNEDGSGNNCKLSFVRHKGKYSYIFDRNGESLALYNSNDEKFFSFPVGARLVTGEGEIFLDDAAVELDGDIMVLRYKNPSENISEASIKYEFSDDEIDVSLTAAFSNCDKIYETELFRDGRKGIYMPDCINFFSPAPRNNFGINRGFYRSICDCSVNGYFSPPPLNFSVGNRAGWVSFGLLDLPESYEYKMTDRLGILIEKPCGKLEIKENKVYNAPRLMMTFPKDEWSAISLFREKLNEKGLIEKPMLDSKDFPDWWKNPLVVTYGDEMLSIQYNWYNDEDLYGDEFNEEWLDNWLDNAEKRLGFNTFTVVVDAYWQNRWSSEPMADKKRFPNFKDFIDKCHKKGHKVLLWYAPFVDNPDDGIESAAKRLGMLTDVKPLADSVYNNIDYSSDNAEGYIDEMARKFFSSDSDSLGCDGLKLDFLMRCQNPENAEYAHPEKSVGIKQIYEVYKTFEKKARSYKPDVLLNASTCEPRFESVLHMNRLHDIQRVYEERELRARVSSLAAPDMLIDSDGAIMLSDWVCETYINAVLYSTPSLYYTDKFHDGVRPDDAFMNALGRLLNLSSLKQYGRREFISEGNWRLIKDGKVIGATFDADSIIIYAKDGYAYFFSWSDADMAIDGFGYAYFDLPDGWSVKDGKIALSAKSGEVYKFKYSL